MIAIKIFVIFFAMCSINAADGFTSITIRNNTELDIETTLSDGINKSDCWIASNRSKTEGFGPLDTRGDIFLNIIFPNKEFVRKDFRPDLKMIPRMGKYPELVFMINGKSEIKMGYTVIDIKPGREYLEISGETKDEFNKRVINDDLIYYSAWGNVDQLKSCMGNGANINARNAFGMSAIMMAASSGKIENFKFILVNEPNLTFVNHNGENLLKLAAGKSDILSILNINKSIKTAQQGDAPEPATTADPALPSSSSPAR